MLNTCMLPTIAHSRQDEHDYTTGVCSLFQRGDKVKQSQGVNTGTKQQQIPGLLTNYEPKSGVQYYRDLAGNIKQVRLLQ